MATDGPGYDLNSLLRAVIEIGASDLLLEVGAPPCVRVAGSIEPLEEFAPLRPKDTRYLMFQALTSAQREAYDRDLELDCAYEMPGSARFRVNVHQQKGSVGAALRSIPLEIPDLAGLELPAVVDAIPKLTNGLVLITGPTGSGKSTTLAALLNEINGSRKGHIVTIEDPVEFVHEHGKSVVTQREVGRDTRSFHEALRRVLRQDPDVILVGEMRDKETIAVALTAANTGHLVLASLHTRSARETVTRIVEAFPGDEQDSISAQLSDSLRVVMTQTLCKRAEDDGRVVAAEVMVCTPAIRTLIKQGKVNQIQSTIQASKSFGMQTLSESLTILVTGGVISLAEAIDKCSSMDDLANALGYADVTRMLSVAGFDEGGPII
jgi:twitching motility protein PilT